MEAPVRAFMEYETDDEKAEEQVQYAQDQNAPLSDDEDAVTQPGHVDARIGIVLPQLSKVYEALIETKTGTAVVLGDFRALGHLTRERIDLDLQHAKLKADLAAVENNIRDHQRVVQAYQARCAKVVAEAEAENPKVALEWAEIVDLIKKLDRAFHRRSAAQEL